MGLVVELVLVLAVLLAREAQLVDALVVEALLVEALLVEALLTALLGPLESLLPTPPCWAAVD